MLYQVDTGSGLIGIKYINADSEDEAMEKTKNILVKRAIEAEHKRIKERR